MVVIVVTQQAPFERTAAQPSYALAGSSIVALRAAGPEYWFDKPRFGSISPQN
jgi:hypothetical protein